MNNTHPIIFEGTTYQCRPTFKAVLAIENTLGKSIFNVGMEITNQTLPLRELVYVYQQLLATGGLANVSAERVGEALVDQGLKVNTESLMKICMSVFTGPKIGDDSADPLVKKAQSDLLIN